VTEGWDVESGRDHRRERRKIRGLRIGATEYEVEAEFTDRRGQDAGKREHVVRRGTRVGHVHGVVGAEGQGGTQGADARVQPCRQQTDLNVESATRDPQRVLDRARVRLLEFGSRLEQNDDPHSRPSAPLRDVSR
jgi:hypothetical protein